MNTNQGAELIWPWAAPCNRLVLAIFELHIKRVIHSSVSDFFFSSIYSFWDLSMLLHASGIYLYFLVYVMFIPQFLKFILWLIDIRVVFIWQYFWDCWVKGRVCVQTIKNRNSFLQREFMTFTPLAIHFIFSLPNGI